MLRTILPSLKLAYALAHTWTLWKRGGLAPARRSQFTAGFTGRLPKVCTAMRFDPATIASRDPQQMLALITRFPRMCEEAWSLGPAGVTVKSPQAVVAVGMGGSGIGGDLLREGVFDEATVPVASIKEYRAPAFTGPQTLVLRSEERRVGE